MNTSELVFGFLPAILSVCCIVGSYLLFLGYRKSLLNVLLLVFIGGLNVLAGYHFLEIMKGAAPILLPYLLLASSIPLLIWQFRNYYANWK